MRIDPVLKLLRKYFFKNGVRSKVDGQRGLNWWSKRLKVEAWVKVDGPKGFNWTVQKSEREKIGGLLKENWTVMRDESERSKRRVTSMSVTNVGDKMCATVYFKDRPFSPFWTVHFEPYSKNEFILQKITLHLMTKTDSLYCNRSK